MCCLFNRNFQCFLLTMNICLKQIIDYCVVIWYLITLNKFILFVLFRLVLWCLIYNNFYVVEQSGERCDSDEPLGFLRTQPQFQQMKTVVQQNPELLNTVLQQIGQSNPALLQLISQHQEAFVRMLNEPVAAAACATGGGGGGGAAEAASSPTTQVPVTPQDKEAIERVSWTLILF